MREIYSAILQVNNGTNNKPFIYKVKRLWNVFQKI
jgi:hypothetical protein